MPTDRQGFYFTFRDRGIFLVSDNTNLTAKIIRKIINVVCDIQEVGDSIRRAALYNEATLKDFRRRIDKASLIYHDTGKVQYYTIKGNNFSCNYPVADFEREIIVVE